jgi:hypothetical protein
MKTQKQLFLILISFLPIFLNYIVLPLEKLPQENYKSSYDKEKEPHKTFINNQYQSIFFTYLEMGTPSQTVPLLLKTEVSSYIITSINSIKNSTSYKYRDTYNFTESFFNKNNHKFYNESKSNSFILNDCDYGRFYEADEQCNANETFLFYRDINYKNITKEEKLYFELMRNVEDNITGEIGLNLYDKNKRSFNSFLNIVKTRNLIDNYNWYFDFNRWDSNKGRVIIGARPHENYPENYIEDDLMYAKVYATSFIFYWKMRFNQIYIKTQNDDIINFNDTVIEFKFDSDVIIGTYEYENYLLSILNKYLNQQKCFNDNITDYKIYSNKLSFYYCKNDGNIKKELYTLLPTIYLYSHEFNYTFEIKTDDILKINNGYIYYLVLFGSKNNNVWYLGKPMSLKYKFIFNPEEKQIGFYKNYYNKKNDENTNNKNGNDYTLVIKVCVIIACCLLLIFLGVVFGKILFGIKRKKRANELLDDNYEYETAVEENKGINN